MRSAHDTKLPSKNKIEFDALHDTMSGLNRSNDRQEFAEELPPSRIVTRYDANSPEEAVDRPVDQMNPIIPERDSTTVGAGIDTFVSHKWDKSKRMILPRNVTNVSTLGNVYAATDKQALGEEEQRRAAEAGSKDEVAPENYAQASLSPEWRQSMINEVKALCNRGCWRVVRTPTGVRLIKSKYVYKLKKDWQGKVTKRKSRLVVQGFLQQEGVDFNETYAPVAKSTTFRLILALTKILKLHLHQLDVDSAFPYADLEKDVFMTPPPGMDVEEGYCLKLLKSLYSLKQAPRKTRKLSIILNLWVSNNVC
jgi:hypothetical protein